MKRAGVIVMGYESGRWAVALAILALAGCSREVSGSGGPGTPPQTSHPCGVKVLASGLQNASAIAYLDQNIYVATADSASSTIQRIPLAGGMPETLVTGLPAGGVRIAVDATQLYWSSGPNPARGPLDGSVGSAPIGGGAPTTLVPSGAWGPLTVDVSHVYWAGDHGSVFRMSLDGSEITTLAPAAADTPVEAIAVDAANVYWGAPDSEYVGSGSTVMKATIDGGAATTVAHIDTGYVNAITTYGGFVYVANGGTTMQTPQTGSQPDYAHSTGNGSIFKVPLDLSSPPVTLASDQPFPFGLAVDTSGVYWGGGGPGPTWAQSSPVPVHRIATGATTMENIGQVAMAIDMTPCLNAVCWLDAKTGSVLRYLECEP